MESELTLNGIRAEENWKRAGIELPSYDMDKTIKIGKARPRWVHFGIGNIFRVFIGGIADTLLSAGALDGGLICVEAYDHEVVDRIYRPFDNLSLSVILNSDGTRRMKVLGFGAEALKAGPAFPSDWERLKTVFRDPGLQIISFTITEKGYVLKTTDGEYLSPVLQDLNNGPACPACAMTMVTSLLYERYQAGAHPLALVSMDNCSHNGEGLRNAVLTVANEWAERGFVPEGFKAYVRDEKCVAFPWTMIDKITPRPSLHIADDLERLGFRNMRPVITEKCTYIAPFVNAEGPQYLVIEDNFPNGRPKLELGQGVFLADRATVDLSERMKVTACLNPVHSALGPLGVLYGIDLFADLLNDPALLKMGKTIAYAEGMPVIADPGILSPQAFTDELFRDRFPNRFLGDTNLRLCTDITQGFGVRFGETIKSYVKRDGNAGSLKAVPMGIAGCMRYAMGIDDRGGTYELAPDPLIPEIHALLSDVQVGEPDSYHGQLKPILSNPNIFFIDLYKAGIGEKIEALFKGMISGYGACRRMVEKLFL